MDVYRPLSAAYCAVDRTRAFMARELGFEWARTTAQDTCFMRPSEQLYPHLEVFTLDYASEFYAHARESQGATAWLKHSPKIVKKSQNLPYKKRLFFLKKRVRICKFSPAARTA